MEGEGEEDGTRRDLELLSIWIALLWDSLVHFLSLSFFNY